MYDSVIEKSQYRKFNGLPKARQEQLRRVVQELAALREPSSHSKAEPLSGPHKGLFRVRVGDYRLICDKKLDKIRIHKIGKRSRIYRNVDDLYQELEV